MVVVENAAIINIDNLVAKKKELEEGDLFFKSTVAFSDEFTTLLSKAHPQLTCMNVIMNFNKIKERPDEIKICEKVFAYLGIKDTLTLH